MTVEAKTKVSVQPFGVEADHPRNCDLIIQCIPGCRVRSAISATRQVIDSRTGEARIPVDQSRHLATLPNIAGMEIHVNPGRLTYLISDPLEDDEETCERIRKRLSEDSPFRTSNKLKGVPSLKGSLDVHRMKSLCRELLNLIKVGHVRVVKGNEPTLEEVEKLPGLFLLNPGSRVTTTQPTFEKDWDDWVLKLTRSGG